MIEALQLVVTAPVVSFRNPLYAGLQVGLPCPPPSTVGGLLAAAAGGWERVPLGTRFAMTFAAEATGTDLETYHPLAVPGTPSNTTIKDREFLARTTLTLWLVEDLDFWWRALRRPVWPLRLGRSQDLVCARPDRVGLVEVAGIQGHALVPAETPGAAGTAVRLTTSVSVDRARSRWDGYRYAAVGSTAPIDTGLATEHGQVVSLLPATHPFRIASAAS
jgi:CRISPR-associated protein Cas5t